MQIVLETPRMRWRRFTLDDVDLLATLDSDPQVMRYISRGQPTPRQTISDEILPTWLAWYSQPNTGYWAALDRVSDAFLGWFHFRPERANPQSMEIGYRLRRAVWGRGLATEGVRALIDNAFVSWGIPAVSATTLITNRASQRVLEKSGLMFDRTFVYPTTLLPTWPEIERRAVRYHLDAARYQQRLPDPHMARRAHVVW